MLFADSSYLPYTFPFSLSINYIVYIPILMFTAILALNSSFKDSLFLPPFIYEFHLLPIILLLLSDVKQGLP